MVVETTYRNSFTVELGQQLVQRNLRNDVPLMLIPEQRRRGNVNSQKPVHMC